MQTEITQISLEQFNPEFPVYISGEGFITLDEWHRRAPFQVPPELPEPLRTQLQTLPDLPATITRLHCSYRHNEKLDKGEDCGC